MIRKAVELAPAVECNFLNDMRAFDTEKSSIKKDEIAARHRRDLWPAVAE